MNGLTRIPNDNKKNPQKEDFVYACTADFSFTANQTNISKCSCGLFIGWRQLFHSTFSVSETWNFLVESTRLNNNGFSAISAGITRIWDLQITLVAIQAYNLLMLLLKLKNQSFQQTVFPFSKKLGRNLQREWKVSKKPQRSQDLPLRVSELFSVLLHRAVWVNVALELKWIFRHFFSKFALLQIQF